MYQTKAAPRRPKHSIEVGGLIMLTTFPLTSCDATAHLIQTTGVLDDHETMHYTTYGVKLTNKDGQIIFVQEDISTSREFVEGFIKWCVDGLARPESFTYHVEDYLAQHM